MTILYYDDTKPDELRKIVERIKPVVGNDILVLPKNFDILLDCSLDQLVSVKGVVDTAIALKMKLQDPDTEILQ